MKYLTIIFVVFLAGCNGCNGSMTDACIPGLQQACACVGGKSGIQRCADDGSKFEACSGCPTEDDMSKSSDIDSGAIDAFIIDIAGPDLVTDMISSLDISSADVLLPDLISEKDLTVTSDLATDMASCGGNQCGIGIVCCNAICVNPQIDSANCGMCNNACPVGTVCHVGRCEYKHIDPFCFFFSESNNYWYDNMANPSAFSSAESELACNACCSATIGAGCPCLQAFTFIGNEKWEYWTFFANVKGAAYFYYSGMLAGQGSGTNPAVKIPQPWFK